MGIDQDRTGIGLPRHTVLAVGRWRQARVDAVGDHSPPHELTLRSPQEAPWRLRSEATATKPKSLESPTSATPGVHIRTYKLSRDPIKKNSTGQMKVPIVTYKTNHMHKSPSTISDSPFNQGDRHTGL